MNGNSRIARSITVATSIFLALEGSAAKGAGPKPTSTPVTSTIYGGAPNTTTGFVILSDSGLLSPGSETYLHGESGVVSQFQSGGNWELSAASPRSFYVDLGPTAPFPAQHVTNGRFITQCAHADPVQVPVGNLAPGSSSDCPTAFAFGVSGSSTTYRLAFHPPNRPGTDPLRFSCTSGVNGKCSTWTFGGVAAGTSNARLIEVVTSRGKTTNETERGDYQVQVQGAISRP